MAGRSLGHYTIRSLLGKGGMGEVYLAEDAKLGRRVALKLLPPEIAVAPELPSEPDDLPRASGEPQDVARSQGT